MASPTPTPQPTLTPGQKYNQGLSDTGYRRKYGNNPDAIQARIRSIFSHRGLSPSAGRIADIYKRRGEEFLGGYDTLRGDVMNLPGARKPDSEFKHLDLAEIRSALAAISAGFGLQRQGLKDQKTATNQGFGLLDERMRRERGESLTGVKSEAAGRGILRSGLYLQDVGDISEAFAQERSAALAERDARLRAIANSLAGLTAKEKAERAAKARELARAQVGPKGDIARALQLV